MPSKNRVKQYTEDSYYHIYNRGVNRGLIFKEDEDYGAFLNLFKRYLSKEPVLDNKKREYPWLHKDIKLLAYCLMPNHFHLLVYQADQEAMQKLMRGVCTSYTRYFNKKYNRVGHLFQDIYKASRISSDAYLLHISRYIHLNPEDYANWSYSSLGYYLGNKSGEWIDPEQILSLFEDESYQEFLKSYQYDKSKDTDYISELADH